MKETKFMLITLEEASKASDILSKSSHYSKLGKDGVLAIMMAAQSLGININTALGGGLYYVKGKVEISSRLMNGLIRSKGHSITQHPDSNNDICILIGKRADNGDTWTESFSLEDAKNAGLLNNQVWKSYTKDMLFARALSRLARQLFADVIANVYVEGEIAYDENIQEVVETTKQIELSEEIVSESEWMQLTNLIGDNESLRDFATERCKFFKTDIKNFPKRHFTSLLRLVTEKKVEMENDNGN